jgi:hypothetical protein
MDVADVTVMFASFPSSALTGQSMVRESRLVLAMNQPHALSIGCLPRRMNAYFAARHFMTGVLIGAALLAIVFVLV